MRRRAGVALLVGGMALRAFDLTCIGSPAAVLVADVLCFVLGGVLYAWPERVFRRRQKGRVTR